VNSSVRRFGRRLIVPTFALFVGACAPAGYGNLGNTYVRWPSQDEQLPAANLLEVETILNNLGYLASRPDGAVGTDTRAAVKHFQSDIGAPVTGFISPTLLAALRSNSGSGATTLAAAPVAAPVAAGGGTGGSGGNSGGGGGRGGGGGAGWN